MQEVMIDIETLSTTPGGIIHQIGAMTFEARSGRCDAPLFLQPDIDDCLTCGLTVDQATVDWWAGKGGVSQSCPRPLRDCLKALTDYIDIHQPRQVWAWGADFDRSMIDGAYKALGLEAPWPYWMTRDARTVHKLAFPTWRPAKGEISHNALQDCRDQIRRVADAYQKLGL